MIELLPPRSYIDFTVPLRPDGSPLTACREPEDYQHYLTWLADYLFLADLPLSEAQQEWVSRYSEDASKMIFACSDIYGYAIWELDEYEAAFAEGLRHLPEERYREIWEADHAEDDPPTTEADFNARHKADLQCAERLHAEWQAEKDSGQIWSHADIPFRAILSHALKQIPKTGARYQELDRYFCNFSDNASK